MEMDELRRRLSIILAAEERQPPDWQEVHRLTDALLPQIHIDATPEIVHHYLDDADIRASDPAYGDRQRRHVRRFVDRGDYEDGTPVPGWTCAVVLTLIVALIAWLVW